MEDFDLEIRNVMIHVQLASADEICSIKEALASIHARLEHIMATIDDLAKDISDETTAIDSVATLVTGLRQQVTDALAGASISPSVQQKLDAVFATAETNKAKLAKALAANVPPASTQGGGGPGPGSTGP